jgi:hypothetical protein
MGLGEEELRVGMEGRLQGGSGGLRTEIVE